MKINRPVSHVNVLNSSARLKMFDVLLENPLVLKEKKHSTHARNDFHCTSNCNSQFSVQYKSLYHNIYGFDPMRALVVPVVKILYILSNQYLNIMCYLVL